MNKLLIVGHPSSHYEDVEHLLADCGMCAARPSRRESMTPVEIGAAVRKAHSIQPPGAMPTDNADFSPIRTGPIWHGLALDLMLGNLDQALWGWADPEALPLLEFWKELDPNLMFVLVYHAPQNLLTYHDGDADSVATELGSSVERWVAYHEALLQFFISNPDRALLVHAGQVGRSVGRYLHQLQSRMKIQLQAPSTAMMQDWALSTTSAPRDVGALGIKTTELPVEKAQALLLDYVGRDLIEQFPAAQQLYARMQSVANLPDGSSPLRSGSDPANAWRATTDLAQHARLLETSLERIKAELRATKETSVQCEHALVKSSAQLEASRAALKRLPELEGKLAMAERALEEKVALLIDTEKRLAETRSVEEHNELLLAQLNGVQAELERCYIENQQLKATVTAEASSVRKAVAKFYGAADRVKLQLSYRLGATMIAHSRSIAGWVGMPLALMREARKYRCEMARRSDAKLPPIASYQDAADADRVRSHLSYRLGARFLQEIRSPIGWAVLPVALRREIVAFRREQALRK